MDGNKSRVRDVACARLAAGVVGFALSVAVDEVLSSGSRKMDAVFARQVAMYLCHTGFEISLARVAVAFDRDRSTVAHACHLVEDRRDQNEFDIWISTLETMLRDAPMPDIAVAAQR